jgi:hypothetical protein
MAQDTQKRVALTPEDGVRMRRLSEEISARLQEMAFIFARTVDLKLGPGVTLKFAPQKAADPHLPPGPPVDVDIEIFDLEDGTHCCYDYINQVCVCPC